MASNDVRQCSNKGIPSIWQFLVHITLTPTTFVVDKGMTSRAPMAQSPGPAQMRELMTCLLGLTLAEQVHLPMSPISHSTMMMCPCIFLQALYPAR
jgi:hypothetical protein